jgi:hypothetical protein
MTEAQGDPQQEQPQEPADEQSSQTRGRFVQRPQDERDDWG